MTSTSPLRLPRGPVPKHPPARSTSLFSNSSLVWARVELLVVPLRPTCSRHCLPILENDFSVLQLLRPKPRNCLFVVSHALPSTSLNKSCCSSLQCIQNPALPFTSPATLGSQPPSLLTPYLGLCCSLHSGCLLLASSPTVPAQHRSQRDAGKMPVRNLNPPLQTLQALALIQQKSQASGRPSQPLGSSAPHPCDRLPHCCALWLFLKPQAHSPLRAPAGALLSPQNILLLPPSFLISSRPSL